VLVDRIGGKGGDPEMLQRMVNDSFINMSRMGDTAPSRLCLGGELLIFLRGATVRSPTVDQSKTGLFCVVADLSIPSCRYLRGAI
jgi:hypothetical protein